MTCMAFLIKLILILLAVAVGLFILSFVVYFFNLDMKMMAAVEPMLNKMYDRRKRDRKV